MMKNKLRSILTTTAATLATVVVGATSASAQSPSPFEALFPYLPTADQIGIQPDDVNLFETALPDFSNLDRDYESMDVMFLGELAGNLNSLDLSLNGNKTSVFNGIQAYNEIDYTGTFSTAYNDMGFLEVGTVWNSRTDGGIDGLSQGSNLNFWLNPNGDATKAFKMGDDARRYGTLRDTGVPLFKAYTLKGLEEYTILAVEDSDYYLSPDIDHNDLVFAVKLNPTDVPEPSTIIGLLGLGAAGLVLRRKSLS